MKYFFIIAVVFLLFSCNGMPKTDDANDTALDDIDAPSVSVVSEPEPEEATEVEETDDAVTSEDVADAEEQVEEEQPAEVAEEIEASDEPDITSLIARGAGDISGIEAENTVSNLTQHESFLPEQPPAQAPSQSSLPPSATQGQSNPPAQTLQQSSSSSSDSSSLQPPIQIPSQSPAQTIPPAPRQSPPAPPPALLGPAEEVTPPPSRVEPTLVIPSAPPMDISVTAAPRDGDIVFSRTVRATVGQTIEIPFTGTGWVYLGEISSKRGIVYNSRRLDTEGQSFIFRAEETGTYALKFFKENFIGGYILNDHVQVIVEEAPVAGGAGLFNPPVDRGRVIAYPRWPSAIEEAEIRRDGFSSRPAAPAPQSSSPDAIASIEATASTQTAIPVQPTVAAQEESAGTSVASTPSTDSAASVSPSSVNGSQAVTADESAEVISPDVLIQRAKETFDGGNAAGAIALLDQLMKYYPSGTDELYWLYGQFYEANTPSRNILLSLDYYKRLVNEYPQSSRLNDARRRIAYLERFYINIQ